ncbi:cytochrome P450 2K1-like [Protopterus annectens]|uniref:cytochrome P450 2K1-like n=1 Tax=Protopterus annectens TaxID=7888 RepID=UPI001CFB1953|nr:cytochrome P450 2K1-like [Protopterus annectens]
MALWVLFADTATVLLAFVLTFLIFLYFSHEWKCSRPGNFPPGPFPFPVIGNLYMINLKRPYRTLLELSKKYGSIFSIQMGPKTMVVLSGYETVKDALVDHADEFAERPDIPIFRLLSNGNGILFGHGESWKEMRRFTLTTLRDFGMGKRSIEEKIIEECGFLIKEIESYEGKPFDNLVHMNAAVANIITSVILGHRLEYDDPKFLRLLHLINETVRLVGTPPVVLFNMFPVLQNLLGNVKKSLDNFKELKSFLKTVFVENLNILDVNHQKSFIDAFLIRQQEEKKNAKSYFHDENLMATVTNLFTAGMETTSTTLRWGILYMMKYPEIQKKVQEEIDSVLGSAHPRAEHRKHMPFTDAVIHETQRLANILPMDLPHETTANVYLRGYFIPKGTYIIPLLSSVLTDKTQWEKPEEFNPFHFLDSNGKFVKKDAFMPFSAGRRICAGETLAKMELFLFFTSLLQKFTFHCPAVTTELDLTPAIGFTLGPMPHKVCAVPR